MVMVHYVYCSANAVLISRDPGAGQREAERRRVAMVQSVHCSAKASLVSRDRGAGQREAERRLAEAKREPAPRMAVRVDKRRRAASDSDEAEVSDDDEEVGPAF